MTIYFWAFYGCAMSNLANSQNQLKSIQVVPFFVRLILDVMIIDYRLSRAEPIIFDLILGSFWTPYVLFSIMYETCTLFSD